MFRTELRAALAAGCVVLAACGQKPYGASTRVIIPRGASFADAADSLSKANLVGWRKMFRVYARVTGGDRNIKPGTYLLKHGTPWKDIIGALNGGHGLVNTITIPEGYTISQIAPLLARTLKVPVESVQAAVRDTSLLARLDIPNPTLEGYLFPDTYAFPLGTTASQAVHEMVYDFERRWKPDWDAKASAMKINRNDLVTMASIVEKGSARSRGAPGHRCRLLQPAQEGNAAPGRPDGAVRARPPRGTGAVQGSRREVALQYVHQQGTAAWPRRSARSRESRGRGQSGQRSLSLFRRQPRRSSRIPDDAAGAYERDQGSPRSHTGKGLDQDGEQANEDIEREAAIAKKPALKTTTKRTTSTKKKPTPKRTVRSTHLTR